jgi:hypothetical protein
MAPARALFLCTPQSAKYCSRMARPYGKRPRKSVRKSAPKKADSTSFKIRLRGKDGAPLSMMALQQGLYDAARELKAHAGLRAKYATLYLTLVDENGDEVVIDTAGEWVIYPYASAADEHGV